MSDTSSTEKSEQVPNKPNNSSSKKQNKPGIFGVLQSVLAAMFGVQSEAKREQDFEKGSAADYIFVGIIMAIIFVLSIIWFVQSTISDYQAAS
ncbi:MAG: DUF2970 domain-containing protein [Gammaproteobacteria bacterium]|nr:DUF2970 domain-containing protein [Gammaproteobacteria bacterium]